MPHSHAMEGDREKAIKAGCDAYAAKPINAPELIALLAKLVREGRYSVNQKESSRQSLFV